MNTIENFMDYYDPLKEIPDEADSNGLIDLFQSLDPLGGSNDVEGNNMLDPITTETPVQKMMGTNYLGKSINEFYDELFSKENISMSKSGFKTIDQLSAQLENTARTSRVCFPEVFQDNYYSTENVLVIDNGNKVKIKILTNIDKRSNKKDFQFNRVTLFYRGRDIYRADFDMTRIDSTVDSISFMIDKKIFEECLNNN